MTRETSSIEILLVEDNPVDVRMVLRAWERASRTDRVTVAHEGAAALALLRREAGYADAVQPDLVLLDLNLPGISGLDVLREIKADSSLHHIPVVVLTSSALEEDIRATYRERAAAFITKPSGIEGFNQLVDAIGDFWGDFVMFATPPGGAAT